MGKGEKQDLYDSDDDQKEKKAVSAAELTEIERIFQEESNLRQFGSRKHASIKAEQLNEQERFETEANQDLQNVKNALVKGQQLTNKMVRNFADLIAFVWLLEHQ